MGDLIVIAIGVVLIISLFMIWSKDSQVVKLLKEQNLYMRVLVKQGDPSIKLPGEKQ